MKLLEDKTAVITGANRGIGKAMVEVFAGQGASIHACARRPDPSFEAQLAGVSERHQVQVFPVYMDLEDTDQIRQAARTITAETPRVDILVNNAAMIFTALFQMTSAAKMQSLFDVNFFAQVSFSQYIVKAMTKHGGSIVNLSSSAAIEGNEGRVAYAASKSAMISFTKVISRELARNKIRANAIAPGLTQTEMMEQSTPQDALEITLERIAMKRVGRPEEIANVALFLASDLSSYMTGQVLRADGGLLG